MTARAGGPQSLEDHATDDCAGSNPSPSGPFTSGHAASVEEAVAHGEGVLTKAHAPIVQLCRTLAAQMDAAGPEGPSARLAQAYLSCLKDLTRALSGQRREGRSSRLARMQRDLPIHRLGREGAA